MVTPRALTRQRVVVAGVGVVEDLGVDALDVRSVARRLHVLPTTLQRFMRDELIRSAVMDEIVGTMPLVPRDGRWQWRLEHWARYTRLWLAGYPGLARYLSQIWLERDETLAVLDGLVEVMSAAGVPSTDRFTLAHACFSYVLGRMVHEPALSTVVEPLAHGRIRVRADRLPHLAASVDEYVDEDPDAHFLIGVRVLVGGIAGMAALSVSRENSAS